ncbi:Ryanodine receptor 2 [Tupaia chinensis]|uniref:Ryanodine receptor 2 n=1 Tax=Tupaia chinensis TaxID=246437 RepID=L9L040_TUPCH|nr:Ryanodine receptor 2 [Tupaia chinensis]
MLGCVSWAACGSEGAGRSDEGRAAGRALSGGAMMPRSDPSSPRWCGPRFIPVCSLGVGQVGRMNFGKDVSTLKYFTVCGLQEGYEPFAVNTNRDVTMWLSKRLPQFLQVPSNHEHIEVSLCSRVPAVSQAGEGACVLHPARAVMHPPRRDPVLLRSRGGSVRAQPPGGHPEELARLRVTASAAVAEPPRRSLLEAELHGPV